jgi:uncharacterized protein
MFPARNPPGWGHGRAGFFAEIQLFLRIFATIQLLMKIFFTFFIALNFYNLFASAQNVPDYHPYRTMTPLELQGYRQSIWDTLPAAIGWVNDFEGLFDKNQEDSIERILEHFEKETTIEIAIVTIDSNMVASDKFDEFAYRLLKTWGIGKVDKSNGIVICICKDYKRLFICTDFGIDIYMNGNEKSGIINKYMVPYFLKNNYFLGTLKGLHAILGKIYKRWNRPVNT